jgi:adenosylcobinamide-GDP ribazoletransferase
MSEPVRGPEPGLRENLRGIRAAFVFLTRIPVGGFPYADAEWRAAPAYFPLVGAVVGAVAGAVDRLLLPLGGLAAALLAIAASMLLTGAFHEDGLADTSDALGGAFDRDKLLVILKDSRIGTFGACAVVVSVVGRAALLARLGTDVLWAFPLVGAAARAGPIWQIATMRYVTAPEHGRSRGVMSAGLIQAAGATIGVSAIAAACCYAEVLPPSRLAGIVAVCVAVTAVTRWRYLRRLGGITGDFLGATEQLCELAAFAVLAWGRP